MRHLESIWPDAYAPARECSVSQKRSGRSVIPKRRRSGEDRIASVPGYADGRDAGARAPWPDSGCRAACAPARDWPPRAASVADRSSADSRSWRHPTAWPANSAQDRGQRPAPPEPSRLPHLRHRPAGTPALPAAFHVQHLGRAPNPATGLEAKAAQLPDDDGRALQVKVPSVDFERVIALRGTEAGIAGLLAALDAAKEALKGAVQPAQGIALDGDGKGAALFILGGGAG